MYMCKITMHAPMAGAGEKWDYVTVRENAHMFWWLYYTTGTTQYTDAPLIMWLQVNLSQTYLLSSHKGLWFDGLCRELVLLLMPQSREYVGLIMRRVFCRVTISIPLLVLKM